MDFQKRTVRLFYPVIRTEMLVLRLEENAVLSQKPALFKLLFWESIRIVDFTIFKSFVMFRSTQATYFYNLTYRIYFFSYP